MSAPTRVAILGAGIGAEHLDGYRALPALYRVRTLCDLDAARAQAVAGEGIAVETDIARVFADDGIDLVDVCLPPHLHLDTCLQALAAGKDVICEKPLTGALAGVDLLADAATRADRRVTPVFQYRYGPALDQLRALRDAGLTGTAYAASLETHWRRDAAYYAVPWRGTWRGENGGAVLGHAIHNHDLLMHVMGPVANVQAHLTTRVNAIETEDCAAIALRMVSGAVATSSVTLGAASDTSRLRFCFEGLTAESGSAPYAPGQAQWRFTARDPAAQDAVDAVVAATPPGPTGFAGFFEARAAQDGREVTLDDGRRSIELVTAIYQAHATGTAVALPLTPDAPFYAGWRRA